MTRHDPPVVYRTTSDRIADALVTAVGNARWPDGSPLVDLHEDVLRTVLAPHLIAALVAETRSHGVIPHDHTDR